MDQSTINEILEKTNIVDVIGNYIPLKRSGSNYKALCPFHDEKTPSFLVSEKKQIFKCFGCGKGGNAITFVRDYEKISFFEALQKLAHQAGIPIKDHKQKKVVNSKRELLLKIYALAENYYQQNLEQHGKHVKEYLRKRKISNETINKFALGYALNSYAGLKNFLIKNNINTKILSSSGLFTKNNNDLFRERLMFPIHDNMGKTIAFGGRILHSDQQGGKYVNSPTTAIYKKGKELYGLHQTKYEISKKDAVLICEGYTDFLRLYENNFHHCVANLGTSLTDEQIRLLSRYTKNFFLLYDGDQAGKNAAVRVAGKIVQSGYTARIVDFENELDPDSFLQKYSSDKLNELLSKAPNLSEFVKNDQMMGLNERSKLEILIEILNDFEDKMAMELFSREIAQTFQISENAVRRKIKRRRYEKNPTAQKNVSYDRFIEESNLLKAILHQKIEYKKVAQEIDSTYYLKEIHRKIFEFIQKNNKNIENISRNLEQIEDDLLKNMITQMIFSVPPESEPEEYIRTMKVRKLENELKQINQKIKTEPNKKEYYLQKIEIRNKLMKLNKKVVTKTIY